MSHISMFLDETGDLGFDFQKKNTSKHFVITVLVCWDLKTSKSFSSAIKRTLKNKINNKNCTRVQYELKGTKTTIKVKLHFYNQIFNENWNLYTLVLKKNNVKNPLRTLKDKIKFYNYLSRVLIEKVHFPKNTSVIDLIVDRSKSFREIEEFNSYLKNQLSGKIPLNTPFNFTHLDSIKSTGIQAVDLFSWGVFRKYEMNDIEWYNIFKEKIILEELCSEQKNRRPL